MVWMVEEGRFLWSAQVPLSGRMAGVRVGTSWKRHWLLCPNNFSWQLFFRNLIWDLLVVCCRAYKTIVEDDLKFPLIYGEGKKVRNSILYWMWTIVFHEGILIKYRFKGHCRLRRQTITIMKHLHIYKCFVWLCRVCVGRNKTCLTFSLLSERTQSSFNNPP